MAAGSAPTRSATVRKENGCSSVRLVGIRGQILPPEITLRGSEPRINPASSSYKLFEDITLVWQSCSWVHVPCYILRVAVLSLPLLLVPTHF